jgi:predicted RNA-binding Zn ribbon-like protein
MTADHGFGSRVGGVLCLDFVNTVRGWVNSPDGSATRDDADAIVGERLPSYDALLRWGEFVELVTGREAKALAREAEHRPVRAATVLRRALALRGALYRLFKAAIAGWPPRPDDLTALTRELQIARAHERLTASPHGITLDDGDTTAALDRLLWPVVRAAVDLLTSSRVDRVGQCPGDECGWLFLDTSRSGRRQWCDMKDCGNVAKVRRFRERARDDHAPPAAKPRR